MTMPICLDPRQRFSVTLEADKSLPDAARPTFIFRGMTQGAFIDLIKDAEHRAKGTMEDQAAFNFVVIKASLRDWKNLRTAEPEILAAFDLSSADGEPVELPFRPDLLGSILSLQEVRELAEAVCERAVLSKDDKKKFATPSSSNQDADAGGTTTLKPESAST